MADDGETLRAALRTVRDPATGHDIVAAGLVEGMALHDGVAHAALRTGRAQAAAMEPVRQAAERALAALPGVRSATVVLTAHRPAEATPPPARPAPPRPAQAAAPGSGHAGGHGGGHGPHAHLPPAQRPKLLTRMRHVIAVASGKGGVGKSTVAVNLAVALARRGLATGLLDADIYGPSLPTMLGLHRKPEVRGDRMVPLEAWGLQAMSIGFLVEADTAMIWRGPMVMGALEQMMDQVEWAALDVLVVDMPPGTGDAQLTMAQRVALAGAVIVSTPQDLALADARRAVKMFATTHVPVLGLVENMSTFICPHCGTATDVFGHGGARAEAARLGIDVLGEVPLLLAVREAADAGAPIVAAAPDGPAGRAFTAIAEAVAAKLGVGVPV